MIPLTRWHHGAKSEQRTQAAGNDIYCENASSTSHVPRQFFDLSGGKGCGIGAGVDDYEAVKNSNNSGKAVVGSAELWSRLWTGTLAARR